MAGRGRGRGASQNVPNDLLAQIVAALQQVNENLQNLNQNPTSSPNPHPLVPPGPAEYRGLDEFCRRNPTQFQGGFAPEAAIEWIQGVERIFRAKNHIQSYNTQNYSYPKAREFSPKRGISHSSEDPLAQARILEPRQHQNITFPRPGEPISRSDETTLAQASQFLLRRKSFCIVQDFTLPIEPSSPRRANSRSGETTLAQARQPSLRRESISIAQD
ncbi:hypothetical protein Lal_00014162 [Lupinus albus]|nr:hypothetical protein Lal_00014162 [Lupinus albus]